VSEYKKNKGGEKMWREGEVEEQEEFNGYGKRIQWTCLKQ